MILLLFLSVALLPINNELMITEVQICGETVNESHIKIFNPSLSKIDLSGYKLRKRSSTGKEYSIRVFPKNSFIDPGDYFIWANSKDEYYKKINADVWSSAGISNNNSVALFNSSGLMIDALAWGDGIDQFVLGDSIPFNSSKNNVIKRRVLNSVYMNTRDNFSDFITEPNIITTEIPETNVLKKRKIRQRENSSALIIGIGIALLSSLSILALKKSLNQDGRS